MARSSYGLRFFLWRGKMKTLGDAAVAGELRSRLLAVRSDDVRRWGTMSAGEMVPHLRGAFRLAVDGTSAATPRQGVPPKMMKLLALWTPARWPHSLPTVPELERGREQVKPGRFAVDQAGLMAAFEDFMGVRENRTAHPMLGAMSLRDWARWGYLHTDHHLRQFGR